MKKLIIVLMAATLLLTSFGCGTQQGAVVEQSAPEPAQEQSQQQPAQEQSAQEPAQEAEPAAAADSGVEIPEAFLAAEPMEVAVVRNLTSDDSTKLFMSGATKEGESVGLKVDTFVTNGDDIELQEIVSQCIQKGYDGIIVSHGKEDYSYSMLKPAIDKGIKVVTFDTIANDENGNPLPGVTATMQDDKAMAQYSLEQIVANSDGDGPVKVLKLWFAGLPPLDRRNEVYEQFEAEGLIETVTTIGPSNMDDVRGDMATRVAAILARYQPGEIDFMWGSWDELAKGALQATTEANRREIKLSSIDVSDTDLDLMRENNDIWVSTVGPDMELIGVMNMRIMINKLAGVDTGTEYQIPVTLIKTEDLQEDTIVATLGEIIPGFGQSDDFKTDWIAALQAQQ